MKKVIVFVSVIAMVLLLIFGTTYKQVNKDYLRKSMEHKAQATCD